VEFGTEFNHVPADIPHTFKVEGWNVKVTAWRIVSAIKTW